MTKWRIAIRRDTVYNINADTFEQACNIALYDDSNVAVEDVNTDWEIILKDESWEILPEERE